MYYTKYIYYFTSSSREATALVSSHNLAGSDEGLVVIGVRLNQDQPQGEGLEWVCCRSATGRRAWVSVL